MKRLALALPLLALAACQSGPKKTSGFLGDYSKLTAKPNDPSAWVYYAPGMDLRDYDSLNIPPIRVIPAPNSDAADLDAETNRKVAAAFRKILTEKIDPYYSVTDKKGPHTMTLRIAITDVRPAKDGVPIGAAAMECELIDSVTGQRLAAAVDRKEGSTKGTEAPEEWRQVEGAFREWAQGLLDFMDREVGK